jgi:hypothetical protein
MPSSLHVSLLSPAVGSGNVGDHFIELAIRRLLGTEALYHRFSIRRPLTASEIQQINETACALICGTNLYQHDWESELTPAMLDRITVPVIPFGVGSSAARLDDTLVGETTRRMIRAIHEKCALGGVRDPHAQRVVARAGVDNVIMTGCPVLFWGGRERLAAVAPHPRRRLVLTARNWLMHRWPSNVDHPAQVELLRRLLAHFERVPIVFPVHEDFDRRLLQLLNVPAEMVLDSCDPLDYVRLYSDPDAVVLAMRLHAGMLARANGLPVVFVGHDTRTYAFCDMLGIECLDLFADDCADRCIQRLADALAGHGGGQDQAWLRFEALRHSMDRFLAANGLPTLQEVTA